MRKGYTEAALFWPEAINFQSDEADPFSDAINRYSDDVKINFADVNRYSDDLKFYSDDVNRCFDDINLCFDDTNPLLDDLQFLDSNRQNEIYRYPIKKSRLRNETWIIVFNFYAIPR